MIECEHSFFESKPGETFETFCKLCHKTKSKIAFDGEISRLEKALSDERKEADELMGHLFDFAIGIHQASHYDEVPRGKLCQATYCSKYREILARHKKRRGEG